MCYSLYSVSFINHSAETPMYLTTFNVLPQKLVGKEQSISLTFAYCGTDGLSILISIQSIIIVFVTKIFNNGQGRQEALT